MRLRSSLLSISFFLSLLFGSALAAQDGAQVIKVGGSDLTGLNASALIDTLRKAKEHGATAVVLDLGGITHLTEAGMDALSAGVQLFGTNGFAVAGLSGDAKNVAEAGGGIRLYPSVDDALSGLGQ